MSFANACCLDEERDAEKPLALQKLHHVHDMGIDSYDAIWTAASIMSRVSSGVLPSV